MSSPVSSPPMPLKCSIYADCTQQKHYKPNLRRKLYKNTTILQGPDDYWITDINGKNLGDPGYIPTFAPKLDSTYGTSVIYPLTANGSWNGPCSDGVTKCGNYASTFCSGGNYSGSNYPGGYTGGNAFCGPWTPRPVRNIFTVMDALLAISITNGGTGYTDGVMTVTYTPAGKGDRAPTFRIKTLAGVIQSATVVDPGAVFTNLTAITTATGGGGSSAVFSFTRQDAVQDFSACSLNGWASVVSMRYWTGFWEFNNPENVNTINCDPSSAYGDPAGSDWVISGYPTFQYEPARLTAPTNKYTTIDIACEYKGDDTQSSPNNHYDVTDSRNMTVDNHSGEVVLNSGTDMGAVTAGPLLPTPTTLLAYCFQGLNAGNAFVGFTVGSITNYNMSPSSYTLSALPGCASGTSKVGYKMVRNSDSALFESWSADFSTGTFNRAVYHPDAGIYNSDYTEDLTITATTFTYVKTANWSINTATTRFTCTATLSTLNTSAAVIADAETIMAPWNLLDRALLPLRTDAWGNPIPKVSRHEQGMTNFYTSTPFGGNKYPPIQMDDYRSWNSGGGVWNKTDWKDLGCWSFVNADGAYDNNHSDYDSTHLATDLVLVVDGAVLGLPLTSPDVSGNGCAVGYFDFRYNDIELCCDNWGSAYQARYGKWLNHAPGSIGTAVQNYYYATQVTNLYEMSELSVGRARSYGSQFSPDTMLCATKSVYSSIRFPSYNHARPYGLDRWLVNELNVGCIAAVSGITTFTGIAGSLAKVPTGFAAGQTWAVFATGFDGVYHIDTYSFPNFTCHSVGSLPSGFNYWDDGSDLAGDSKGLIFQLRMPSCPPFGGRLSVTSVTDNHDGTCTIVTEATPVKIDDAVPSGQTFTVDLCDTNMSALSSNKTATTSSLTTFKVTETYATIAAAKWVTLYGSLDGEPTVKWATPDETLMTASHPIPKWYWNYTVGNGVMVQGEWTRDYRTNSESARIATVCSNAMALDPHIPACVCASPTPACSCLISGPATNLGYDAAHTSFSDTCKGSHSCGPWLIVFSPNATDTPPAGQGVRYDFTYSLPLDERYSSIQWIDCYQGMVDPLFQSPHGTCGMSMAPTCIPIVEARAVLPGSTGHMTPPDGGGGPSLNQVPPPPLNDYTLLNPATNSTGNLALPPSPAAQPDVRYAPSGIFTPC